MRKPKVHPKYGNNLVGINFRERWNVVEYATKDELEKYISNFLYIKRKKTNRKNNPVPWWEWKQSVINENTHNIYLRKLWRKRHSESFQKDKLYRLDKAIKRWNVKLGPISGDGMATFYHFDRNNTQKLCLNDIVILTKVDEMGNLYFAKINEINARYPYVFNRDNAQLSCIVPVET